MEKEEFSFQEARKRSQKDYTLGFKLGLSQVEKGEKTYKHPNLLNELIPFRIEYIKNRKRKSPSANLQS